MIMCRMTCPSGNLQGAGVTGHTLTRTVSDLLRSRRPFLLWESAGPKFFPSHATRDVFNRGNSEPAGLVFAYRLPE
jgi:hypothetical protein